MNVEESRLRTFSAWPANVPVEPQRIAKAGFFATGNELEVECFSCHGKISEWNYGDQVMTKHKHLNPQCPFVLNPIESGNIPLITGSRHSSIATPHLDSNPSSSNDHSLVFQLGNWDQTTGFRNETIRLESFRTWPIPHIISPESLARSGFYYLLEGDKVQCVYCSGIISQWEQGDAADTEHRKHFPMCPSFCEKGGCERACLESCSAKEIRPFSAPEDENFSPIEVDEPRSLSELGINTHRGPVHPKYATYESRLRTYSTWPPGMSQSPEQLAQAGFYYFGINDQVRCFHCDGGLRQFDPEDDPWVEHARWFSKCAYILLVKGPEFIQETIKHHPPVLLPNEVSSDLLKQDEINVKKKEESNASFKLRVVSEEELEGLLQTPAAQVALEMQLDPRLIKRALKAKMEETGIPFSSSDELVWYALDLQNTEETVPQTSEISEQHIPDVPEESESSPRESLASSQSMPCLIPNGSSREESLQNQNENAKSLSHLGETKDIGAGSSDLQRKTSTASLEEENRILKEARLCKICMDEDVGVVFLPCGHLVTCVNCAPSLHDCPMCRKMIKATVRTFFS